MATNSISGLAVGAGINRLAGLVVAWNSGLAAISGLVQALIQVYHSRQLKISEDHAQQNTLNLERADWLPDVCPKCGGPVSVGTVNWTGSNTADCPYCKANLRKPA